MIPIPRYFSQANLLLFHVGTLLSIVLQDVQAETKELMEFNRDLVGAVFSPHVHQANPGRGWDWKDYTQPEVVTMLELVETKFRNISLYGMGVFVAEDISIEGGDAVGFTGTLAAGINQRFGKVKIAVCLAVWRHDNTPMLKAELAKAFDVMEKANAIHRGTVWGITFSSNWAHDPVTTRQVIAMLPGGTLHNRTMGTGVKIGARISICELVISSNHSSDFLRDLLVRLDYVICTIFTPTEPGKQGIPKAVEHMKSLFLGIKGEIVSINKNIQVIFETGWPSNGIGINNLPTSIENLRDYWAGMGRAAMDNNFHLNLFEAIDEPWKSDRLSQDRKAYDGPCGGEGHFGWWRRRNNSIADLSGYVEKITEKQSRICAWERRGNSGNTALIVGLCCTFIVIALTVGIVILYYKLRLARAEKLTEEDIEDFEKGMILADGEGDSESVEVALRLPYDRKYELMKNQFKIDKHMVLGSGQFGIVYKGSIDDNNMEIAFKTTKPRCPVENLKSLLAEIKLMIYIGTHPNIVGLIGAYTAEIREGGVYIACEFCSQGSLEKVLRAMCDTDITDPLNHQYDNVPIELNDETNTVSYSNTERYVNNPNQGPAPVKSKNEFDMQSLIRWSCQIANGMQHLTLKRVIHADLAARNVLVTGNGTAKITDFGLSRKMYAYTNYVKQKQEPLPWRWMAMESLQRLSFSTQSDVWSYGVTLWEIFTLGDVPYPGLAWDIGFVDQLKQGLRLHKPKHANEEIYSEMCKCWHVDADQRPAFDELVRFFGQRLVQTDGTHEKEYYQLDLN